MSMPVDFAAMTRAGKGGAPPLEPLTAEEVDLFNEAYNYLVGQIRRVDRDVAVEFEAMRGYYQIVAEIFKARTKLAFGGLFPDSGQFGMMLIPPRPFKGSNTWDLSVTSAGWANLWGSSSSPITGSVTDGQRRCYYIQGILYLTTGPEIKALRAWINGHEYTIQWYEEGTLPKPFTTIRYLGFDKNIFVDLNGRMYLRALFHKTGTLVAKPLGLMFAEYDYLRTEGNFYT